MVTRERLLERQAQLRDDMVATGGALQLIEQLLEECGEEAAAE